MARRLQPRNHAHKNICCLSRISKQRGNFFRTSAIANMIAPVVVGVLAGLAGYAYLALRPPPPKVCGSPGGPPVTSPRVKLSDGRHLAYKERGAAKEEAKYKIIVSHGFSDSKDFNLPISQELLKELQIYVLSFDRAGYGESSPNPKRSVKSDALDVQELADNLQLGPKFYLIGISLGASAIYGCLKLIPHRVSGAALVVPVVNYWWPCFPAKLAQQSLKKLPPQDQRTLGIAHYFPWLFHWWMTQKWFSSLSSMEGKMDLFSPQDIQIIKKLSESPSNAKVQEKALQQGVHECLYRDLIVSYGKWGFDPTDISNPFPDKKGSVHIWQGYEDKFIPFELNRYLSKQLPWIRYHEIPDTGHLLIYNATLCEAIFRELLLVSA